MRKDKKNDHILERSALKEENAFGFGDIKPTENSSNRPNIKKEAVGSTKQKPLALKKQLTIKIPTKNKNLEYEMDVKQNF